MFYCKRMSTLSIKYVHIRHLIFDFSNKKIPNLISNIQCSFARRGNPHCFGAKKTSHKAALQPPGFGTQQGIQLPPASLRSKSGFHTYSSVLVPIQKLGKRPQENTERFEKLKEKMTAWSECPICPIILLWMILMDAYRKIVARVSEG